MTDYTLKILKRPADATAKDLEDPYVKFALVQNLAFWARDCGAYPLRSWAENNDAPLHYIDNCSVRAEASGAQVRKFAAEVLKEAVLDSALQDDGAYLIEASEF